MFVKEVDILAHACRLPAHVVVHRATSRNTILIEQVLALLSARHVLTFTERPYDAEDGGASIVWPNEVALDQQTCSWSGSTLWLQSSTPQNQSWPGYRNVVSQSISENTVIDWENSIAVHLKQSLTDQQSNADIQEWSKFFTAVLKKMPKTQFLLVGDDSKNIDYKFPENVFAPGSNLIDYWSILRSSAAFMGMASGLCNYPLLEGKPCRIWKHKDHHPEHMRRELDSRGQFSFSNSHQKMLLEQENLSSLLREFHSVTRCLPDVTVPKFFDDVQ